jgi:hypothetical protein
MKVLRLALSIALGIVTCVSPAPAADFEFRGTVDATDPTSRLLAFYAGKFAPEELSLTIDEPPDKTGRFRDIYMDLTGVRIGGVRVERLTFRMNDVRFNPPPEWADGNVECREALQIYAYCLLREADINEKLGAQTFGKDDHWKDISMKITPAGLQARGIYVAKVLFVTLNILIEAGGGIRIVEGRELWLDDYKVRVNALDVPDYITRKAISQIQPLLDLGRFPLPLRLHSVEFQERQAVFSTRIPPEAMRGITYHYLAD